MKKIFLLFPGLCLSYFVEAQVDSSSVDSLLLIQIQSQLNSAQPSPAPARAAASAIPDISVIGDFRGMYHDNYKRHFNVNLHETEISFQSVVDPYARADFFISLSRDAETGKFSAEVEEGYLTTLSLPAHLQLKAGKFKQALGKINPVHPHALPFVDMPNAYVRFFGEEGMNDEGLQLSWLLPNRMFFQELTVEATDGPRESPSFIHSTKNNYVVLAHLKNFWDLTHDATLEFGLSGVSGANFTEHTTTMGAADLTYKWKPVKFNTYKLFLFQNEFYYSHAVADSFSVNSLGFYSLVQMQISRRTFITARYDYTNKPFSDHFTEQAASATWGWYATEFQKIEVEAKRTSANETDEENNFRKNFTQIFLRWIFVIGSHGAHQY
jgi:hypothetical protein